MIVDSSPESQSQEEFDDFEQDIPAEQVALLTEELPIQPPIPEPRTSQELVFYDEEEESKLLANWDDLLGPSIALSPTLESPAPEEPDNSVQLRLELLSLVEIGAPGIFQAEVAEKIISCAAKLIAYTSVSPDEMSAYSKLADLKSYINSWFQHLNDEAASRTFITQFNNQRMIAGTRRHEHEQIKAQESDLSARAATLTIQAENYRTKIARLQRLLAETEMDLEAAMLEMVPIKDRKFEAFQSVLKIAEEVAAEKAAAADHREKLRKAKVGKQSLLRQFEFLHCLKNVVFRQY